MGKQNLSPEERERRRQRMIELRKKLEAAKSDEPPKPKRREPKAAKPIVAPEPSESEASESSESESDGEVQEPVRNMVKRTQPAPKPARAKSTPSTPRAKAKQPVMKKISVKYYGTPTQEEIDSDRALFDQLQKSKPKKGKKAMPAIEESDDEQEVEEPKPKAKPEPKPEPKAEANPHAMLLKQLGY